MAPFGRRIHQSTAVIGAGAAGLAVGLKAAAVYGISFIGTVSLSQLPAQVSLELHLLTASGLVAASDQRVQNTVDAAVKWLGPRFTHIRNTAGDSIFISADRLRKIRFDYLNSHGDRPHLHLQVFVNGKWRDAIQGLHRLYPNQ